MSCCVPECRTSGPYHTLIALPADRDLRTRWLQAIKVGTGHEVAITGESLRICRSHFARPDARHKYQEPALFVVGESIMVRVASCRLCHQFFPEEDTLAARWQLPLGGSFPTMLANALKIRLQPFDFLQRICRECLAKVDLVRNLQKAFSMDNLRYEYLRGKAGPLEIEEPGEECMDDNESSEDLEMEVETLEEVDEESVENDLTIISESLEDIELEVELLEVHEKPVENNLAKKSESLEDINLEVELLEEVHENDHPKKRRRAETSFNVEVELKVSEQKRIAKGKRHPRPVKVKRRIKLPVPKRPRNATPIRDIIRKTCYICSTKFEDTGAMELHLSEFHLSDDGHKCAVCNDGKLYPRVSRYNHHLSFHDPIRPIECEYCPMRYSTVNSTQVHENKAHGANHIVKSYNEKPTQCDICGKMFSNAATANAHKRQIHNKVKRYNCQLCPKSFQHPNGLGLHMESHSKHRPFKCDICTKRYRDAKELKRHVLSVHEGKAVYRCVPCELHFTAKKLYVRHKSEVHRNNRVYFFTCLLCKEIPQTRTELLAHIEQHHPDQDYPYRQCERCGAKSLTAAEAGTHSRQQCYTQKNRRTRDSEGVKPFMCDICGKSYVSKHVLKNHIEEIHLGLPKKYLQYHKPVQCNICGKTLNCHANLQRHLRCVHKKERPFKCDLCDATFGQKNTMQDHRRNIHTHETPFWCRRCGMRFKEGPTWSKHRKKCERRGEEVSESD